MILLPPPEGTCPICAIKHDHRLPHNMSLYYFYRFYGTRGRWPTWADALAHCPEDVKRQWKEALQKEDAWTEPENEPIADPPLESVYQTIGDIASNGFGPTYDPSMK